MPNITRPTHARHGNDQRGDYGQSNIAVGLSGRKGAVPGVTAALAVCWLYLDNQAWVEEVTSGAYREWMETNYAGR